MRSSAWRFWVEYTLLLALVVVVVWLIGRDARSGDVGEESPETDGDSIVALAQMVFGAGALVVGLALIAIVELVVWLRRRTQERRTPLGEDV